MIVSSTIATNSNAAAATTSGEERSDNLTVRIRLEFLQELNERLEEIANTIIGVNQQKIDISQGLEEIQRNLLAIQSGSRATELTGVETIAHCFLNYLRDLTTLTPRQIGELNIYNQAFKKVILKGQMVDENEMGNLVRSLPPRWSFEVSDVVLHDNMQILLVGNDRTQTMIVERELMACGYRSLTLTRSSEALEMIVRTKPDMVICTAVLDLLTGVDMACAIAAMPSTKKIPLAIMTTYAETHPELEALPPSVAIISKGEKFSDDFARALSRFGLT